MTIDFSTGDRSTQVFDCDSFDASFHLPAGDTNTSVVWADNVPEGRVRAQMTYALPESDAPSEAPSPDFYGNVIRNQHTGTQTITGGMTFGGGDDDGDMGFTVGGTITNSGPGKRFGPVTSNPYGSRIRMAPKGLNDRSPSGARQSEQSSFVGPNTLKLYVSRNDDGQLLIQSLNLSAEGDSSIRVDAPHGTQIGRLESATRHGKVTYGPLLCDTAVGRAERGTVEAEGLKADLVQLSTGYGPIKAKLQNLRLGGLVASGGGDVNTQLFGEIPSEFRATTPFGEAHAIITPTAESFFQGSYEARSGGGPAQIHGVEPYNRHRIASCREGILGYG